MTPSQLSERSEPVLDPKRFARIEKAIGRVRKQRRGKTMGTYVPLDPADGDLPLLLAAARKAVGLPLPAPAPAPSPAAAPVPVSPVVADQISQQRIHELEGKLTEAGQTIAALRRSAQGHEQTIAQQASSLTAYERHFQEMSSRPATPAPSPAAVQAASRDAQELRSAAAELLNQFYSIVRAYRRVDLASVGDEKLEAELSGNRKLGPAAAWVRSVLRIRRALR
jgi:uncharacterized coiled-coil protein SlyX